MFIRQLLIGILVGLYSYLSPGIINIQIFRLSLSPNQNKLFWIIALIAAVEIPYCLICLKAFSWLNSLETVQQFIHWGIVLVMFGMAGYIAITAYRNRNTKPSGEASTQESKSVKSLLVFALLNPFQWSAWSIWGAYFTAKSWFDWSGTGILIFSLGACAGTFVILYLYAWIGRKWITLFNTYKVQIDYGIAVLLFLLGVFHILKK
jgi:threonine/homoserine/homoserine lactone efflux protein